MTDAKDQLVIAAIAGDQQALRVLLVSVHGLVRATVSDNVRYHALLPSEIDDLVQESFARIFTRITQLDADNFGAFCGWMKELTRNVVRSANRHRTARKRYARAAGPNDAERSFIELVSASRSPGSRAIQREQLALIASVFQHLQRDQRAAFQQRFIEDRSYHEIASALMVTPAAARMLVMRARKRLREILRDKFSSDISRPVVESV